MCSNETYHKVQMGKYLSDTFPIYNGLKRGDNLSPLLFNFVFEQPIKKFQANQGVLKLNVTHQLVVCADYVTSWANTHSTKKIQKLY
jgi:hypothetical protein